MSDPQDMTRQATTEEVLRQHRQQYRALLEYIEDGYYEVDLAGNFVFTNAAMCELMGYPPDKLLGCNYRMAMSAETGKAVYQVFNGVFKTGMPSKGSDWEIIGQDGSKRYVEASISLLKDAAGEATGFCGILRDVTGRRQREDLLRESEERYRVLLEFSPDPIVLYDLQGNTTYLNPAFEEAFGWSAEELLGKRIDFVPPENVPETQRAIEQVFDDKKVSALDTRRFTKDGRVLDIQLSAALYKDKQGNPLGLTVILRDVTAHKQVTEAQRQSEERNRLLLESSPDPIVIYDDAGQATYVNPAFVDTFGWQAEELLGKRIDFVPPENMPETQEAIKQIFSKDRISALNTRRYTKDGRILDIQLSASLHRDREGNPAGINVILRDVTAHRQAEEALRRAHDELELRVNERTAELTEANVILQQQREYLTALHETTLGLINRLDISDLLESLIARAANLVNTAHGYICLVEPDKGTMVTSVGVGVFSNRLGDQLEPGEGVAGKVWQSGQLMIVDDYGGWSDRRSGSELDQVHALLAVPLKSGSDVVGVTGLAYLEPGRKFTSEEVESLGQFAELASIALDNARLYSLAQQELSERKQAEDALRHSHERRGRQVEIATLVAQEITTAPDLSVLYQRVVSLVKEQFGYYHAQLLQYDPAVKAVFLVVGYGLIGEKMLAAGHKMSLGQGLIGTAAVSGQSVLRSDVRTDPQWRPNPLLPETQGEIAVPIKLRDDVLGILDVQSDKAGLLDTEDQLLLEGLCGQIAAAIESTRLRQEMSTRLDELHRLQRFLSHEGWQTYHARSEQARRGYVYDRTAIRPLPADLLPAPSNGQENGEDSQDTTVEQALIRTTLAVRGTVIGALGVHYDAEQPLTTEDEALLESIGVQVAEAMESARLLEQIQKRAVELETAARVSTAASTILQVDKLLQTVVDLTQLRFGLYYVSIFLFDEDSGLLRMAAGSGDIGRQIVDEKPEIALDQARSLVARAAREREPLIVNDVLRDPTYLAQPLLPDTRSEMVIPMILGERLLGVFDVEADFVNAFTPDDLRIQTTLAAQVAVAVQNANLYAEQLATATKLRELDRLKSEFLASMSHELRTPLNSIIGFADVLLEGIDGHLTPRMEEDISLIRESGRHLRELIGDILDMSKIEAGMMALRYESIDLPRLARDVIATFARQIQSKPLDLFLDIDPDVTVIQADRTRVIQVMLNLMSNAIKFTERGRVTLAITSENSGVRIAIADTGIGIQDQDIPIVFEQFRQVDGSLTRRVGGTGLGLPISKKLIEMHGGEMGLQSELGVGTTFWFTLPIDGQLIPSKKPDTGPLRS
jgi:PAS domain S-box-containing protein